MQPCFIIPRVRRVPELAQLLHVLRVPALVRVGAARPAIAISTYNAVNDTAAAVFFCKRVALWAITHDRFWLTVDPRHQLERAVGALMAIFESRSTFFAYVYGARGTRNPIPILK